MGRVSPAVVPVSHLARHRLDALLGETHSRRRLALELKNPAQPVEIRRVLADLSDQSGFAANTTTR